MTQIDRLLREKGDRPQWMTSTEFAAYLGIGDRRFRRWQKSGKIPEPAGRTESGWGLWSPDQQLAMMKKRARVNP